MALSRRFSLVICLLATLLGLAASPGATATTPPPYTKWGPPLTARTIDGADFIIDANGVPHRLASAGDNAYADAAHAQMTRQLQQSGLAYNPKTRTGVQYVFQSDANPLVPKGPIGEGGTLSGTTADMLKLSWSNGKLISVDVVDATGTSNTGSAAEDLGKISNTIRNKLPAGRKTQADNVVFVGKTREQAEALAGQFQGNPNVRILHPSSGYDTGEFEAGTTALREAAGHLFATPPPDCLPSAAPCGGQPAPPRAGGLARALGPKNAGGIDFTRLELRYLSDSGGLRYAFKAPVTAKGSSLTGLANAQQASDSFFTWLQLEPSTFWVNLNPNEPDRIIDARLGRTDTGRIMLQADLMLKKTTGKLIHPDTSLGATYWRSLKGSCTSFRTWIVPAPATVYTTGDKLHILKSPLDVQTETQYLKQRGGSDATSCKKQSEAVQEHNESAFRRLILPRVVDAVNTAPEYADLRRVYLSRIAAEWYRDLSTRQRTTYGRVIDSGDISAYATRQKWKPRDTFDAYVRSYTKGEFNVKKRTRKGDYLYTHTYVYGGVDFTNVRFNRVTSASPALTDDVDHSLTEPTKSRDGIWLGGEAPPTPGRGNEDALASPEGDDDSLATLVQRCLVAAGAAAFVIVAARATIRSRRARRGGGWG
ncbi:hypothetical protein [Streptomyces sp. NBC_01363]|uniref:hypothetical protein n=1 Tax=Streptomyces sp. NBC_01363 TaxID=2903840 RepID=UPI00224D1B7E|nr:hypothetical protein [Streptomyces sp. NBC_01363]MCX4734528.1 hypothetical protein [Streptomyces sp. NBC_01363]